MMVLIRYEYRIIGHSSVSCDRLTTADHKSMKIQLKTMALILAMAPAMVNSAAVYKCTDADGVTHFGDRQPIGTAAGE
ncbi:uncharacterized protein DUF4124 [Marinobacter sp. LV10MA510-1]|nr:uncharacterized protein DUF4124 [Marinobacter sp. LV10MA510-1]